MATIARNDPCPCGSGEKYKKCCMGTGGAQTKRRSQQIQLLAVILLIAAIAVGVLYSPGAGFAVGVAGAILLGAFVYFTNPPPPRSGGNPGAINFGR